MSILSRLDVWLGKTLFHPPIILACQITRQTQHAMSRALWFFASCHATYYIGDEGWGWAAFMWFWTIIAFISAATFPDVETRSWGGFRLLMWVMSILATVSFLHGAETGAAIVRNLIILFAEYAATIKTIPPRRKRERNTSAQREVRA